MSLSLRLSGSVICGSEAYRDGSSHVGDIDGLKTRVESVKVRFDLWSPRTQARSTLSCRRTSTATLGALTGPAQHTYRQEAIAASSFTVQDTILRIDLRNATIMFLEGLHEITSL